MKNKILEALTTKFAGVDAKILEGIAEKISKTLTKEEEIANSVEGVTFQKVLESYGDRRATDASITAVKTYESKHGLKDGKLLNPPTPPTPPAPAVEPPAAPKPEVKQEQNDIPEYMKAFMESLRQQNEAQSKSMAALQAEIANMKTQKLTEDRKTILNKEISKLSEAHRSVYSRVPLETMSDEDFNGFMDEVKTSVNAFEKEKAAASAPMGKPLVGGTIIKDGKATESDVDKVASIMGIGK